MRVLVACEESGVVRRAFQSKGWEAYSNDLIPASDGQQEDHLQMDCKQAIELYAWDLIIMHPPCTHLAVSGNRWYGRGTEGHQKRLQALDWTIGLWNKAIVNCSYVALENPVGVLSQWRKPTQYIQPWEYGHGETKKTGLWLHNLNPLEPTNIVGGREQRVWKLPPSQDRQRMRSETYAGIAEAMADQWTKQILSDIILGQMTKGNQQCT